MKTPKRKTPFSEFWPHYFTWEGANLDAMCAQRWKRKNRIAQLKRTIARMKREKEEVYNRLKREKEEAYHRGHQPGMTYASPALGFNERTHRQP